jgi:uncharacterized membrane protein
MFDVAVALKAVNGALQIVVGYFLIFKPGWVGPHAVVWAATLLSHDPDSWFAQRLAYWGEGLTSDTEHFASTYLIAHGAVKVFVAWGLLREKLWAFPTGLALFGLIILYEIFRFAHTHSVTLAILIPLDMAICYLIWREYGFRRESLQASRDNSLSHRRL